MRRPKSIKSLISSARNICRVTPASSFTENYNMSNTSLIIILLVTLGLTVVVAAVSGISSTQQAKAQTTGQKGKNEATSIGDKDLLQVDATIIAGILILLTI
jgi:hypothetical protein